MRRYLLRFVRAGYLAIRKTGLLQSRLGRWLFVVLYDQYKRWIEDPFLGLTRLHPELFRGGHVFDVGANNGYTAAVFSRAVPAPFRVFAFEPEPGNFEMMQRRLRRTNLPNVTAWPQAVGAECRQTMLYPSPVHPADHRLYRPQDGGFGSGEMPAPIPVTVTTLDRFCEEQGIRNAVSFVKIDVQGYELEVLKGMAGLLRENPRLKIGLEIDDPSLRDAGTTVKEMVAFLAQFNVVYQLIDLNGRLTPLDPDEAEKLVLRIGYIDVLVSRKEPGK